MIDGFEVVTAHDKLLAYVDGMQRKNAEALSFYPKCVFERESAKGRVLLGLLHGEPCGYLYLGAVGVDMKCHQVCIEYDNRRKLYGAALVGVMENIALSGHAYTVTLRCGFDLDANSFWGELGYKCIAVKEGGVRRMRKINVWQKEINAGLFDVASVDPAEGRTNSTVWRKSKRTGLVTQFVRGARLDEYRALVTSGKVSP